MKKPADPEWSMRTSTTPRTDNLIADVMAKHPGQTPKALAAYYEAVHQELAPLARELEAENKRLWAELNQRAEA